MLRIQIAKRPDGTGLLRCVRADGSVTWQKQPALHAIHFVLHDLTHFAVEAELRFRQGFFGLVAQGWDLEDTTGKGARGELPAEALEVERLVGLFDAERAGGCLWTAAEFNQFAGRHIAPEEIRRVRAKRTALYRAWLALAPGSALDLEFDSR